MKFELKIPNRLGKMWENLRGDFVTHTVVVSILAAVCLTMVQIERIQNPYLYLLYMTKKEEMDKRNPGGQNEKKLWHGTAGNNVQNINSRNFNRSYGGVHGTYRFTVIIIVNRN